MRNILRFLLLCGLAAHADAATGPRVAGGCDREQPIQRLVLETLSARGISEEDVLPFEQELCSRTDGVRAGAAIELLNVRWDAVLHAIEFRLRCKTPGACLPFLLRVRIRASGQQPALANLQASAQAGGGSKSRRESVTVRLPRLVRPGQMVTLIWDQGDMHIERRVVCLDSGSKDQEVRTRPKEGGRVVHARVLASGLVKAL